EPDENRGRERVVTSRSPSRHSARTPRPHLEPGGFNPKEFQRESTAPPAKKTHKTRPDASPARETQREGKTEMFANQTTLSGKDIPKEARTKIPESFDGKKGKEAKIFITKMELFFDDFEEGTFNDYRRIKSTLMNMKSGEASNWAQPLLQKLSSKEVHEFLASWENFKKAFLINFDDPVRREKAVRELNSLKQTRSTSEYATEFRILAQEVDWDRNALIDKFKISLKPEVQKELLRISMWGEDEAAKATLEEWITLACKADDLAFNIRKLDPVRRFGSNQSHWAPRNKNTLRSDKNTGNSRNTGTTKPKDTVRIPLEEKKRRREAGLCMKCGKPGHVMKDCRGDWTYNEKKVQGKAGKELDQGKEWDAESEN
ncbi:hypothetical protein FRC09_016822, partial [Ceratobasidium sp. 395]